MLHNPNIKSKQHILLVEDNLGDVRLIQEAVRETGSDIHLDVVNDGVQAMNFLYKKDEYCNAVTPDLILLDLNIPKKNGKQVLQEIKNSTLKCIPILVLTISQSEDDILFCYNAYVNGYITKPIKIDDFIQLFKSIVYFWFDVVKLPPKKEADKHG